MVTVGRTERRDAVERDWYIRTFEHGTDTDAVLGFQRETYEANFPEFLWSRAFIREFAHILSAAHSSPGEALYVCASLDEAILGFVWVSVASTRHDRDCYIGLIKDIYVVPERRAEGIGEALMQEAEEYARRSGAARLTLQVTTSNSAAVRLYGKLGFQVARYHMEKRLG